MPPLETVSSRRALMQKHIVPLFLILGFGVAAANYWLNPNIAPPSEKYISLAIFIFCVTLCIWGRAPWNRVRLGASEFYFSDFIREIKVPYTEIESVSNEPRFWLLVPVTIRLRNDTKFGRTLNFIPRNAFPGRVHPVVYELRRRAGLPPEQEFDKA